MLSKSLMLSLGLFGILGTVPAMAGSQTLNLYIIGSNPPGNALDPVGNNIGGMADIMWTHNVTGNAPATLSILAEGIDGGPNAPGGGEHDQVFFNGTLIGDLTQQSFYSPLFNLQPGPGALPGITAETLSVFDVSGLFVSGLNTVEVKVDPGNWVDEVEVSTLTAAPEPSTWAMVLAGFIGLGLIGRRARRSSMSIA
jgi:hypothetical protein